MKKLFYGLGAIAVVTTPIVAVVSCGPSERQVENADITKPLVAGTTFKATASGATLKVEFTTSTDGSQSSEADYNKLLTYIATFLNSHKGETATFISSFDGHTGSGDTVIKAIPDKTFDITSAKNFMQSIDDSKGGANLQMVGNTMDQMAVDLNK